MAWGLLAGLLQALGSLVLACVTLYTLRSYLVVERRYLGVLRSYAYKRPLVIPNDYDRFIEELAHALEELTGGRRVTLVLALAVAGLLMIAAGFLLELIPL